jgi:hypothetical protein
MAYENVFNLDCADALRRSCDASGGQPEKVVEAYCSNHTYVSFVTQKSNPTSWWLANMNLSSHSNETNIGKERACFFRDVQHSGSLPDR